MTTLFDQHGPQSHGNFIHCWVPLCL